MRLKPVHALLLATVLAAALTGCSRKAERLVGADRLIRGPGGLGTTTRLTRTPDRDTYVENGTAVYDSMLIVGTSGTYEARSLLYFAKVTLPDTTLPGFTPQSISLELTRNLTLGFSPTLVNAFQTTLWDSATVSWPGPAAGAQLGSVTDDRTLASFSLPLNSASFALAQQWAQGFVPARFLLQTSPGQPVAAYVAGTVKLRIRYTHTVSSATVLDSVDSPVSQNLYVHSPLTPTPTGADSALVWGGLYRTELAMHFLVDSLPAGVSVDEATLVLRLLSNSALPDSADIAGRIAVRAIRSAWSEGVSERSAIPGVDSTSVQSGNLIALYSPATGSIAIRLPGYLVRSWATFPSTNGGVLITLDDHRNLTKQFLIGSRESSQPAELHVSYTGLPPGRF